MCFIHAVIYFTISFIKIVIHLRVANENILGVAKDEGNVVTKNPFYIVVFKQNKLFFQRSDCYYDILPLIIFFHGK